MSEVVRLPPAEFLNMVLTASVKSKSPSQSAQGQAKRKKAGAAGKSVRSCGEGGGKCVSGSPKSNSMHKCSMFGKSLRSGSARKCSLVSCSRLGTMAFAAFRAASLISAGGGGRAAQALLGSQVIQAQAGVGCDDCEQMMIGTTWQ